MTAYFDNVGSELDNVGSELAAANAIGDAQILDHRLCRIEETLVYDVTLCLESPGFPADLREKGHRIILKRGVHTRPINDATHPTVESLYDVRVEIGRMSSDLHDLFHEACCRGFSDDPRSPMRFLFARGEQFREDLVDLRPE